MPNFHFIEIPKVIRMEVAMPNFDYDTFRHKHCPDCGAIIGIDELKNHDFHCRWDQTAPCAKTHPGQVWKTEKKLFGLILAKSCLYEDGSREDWLEYAGPFRKTRPAWGLKLMVFHFYMAWIAKEKVYISPELTPFYRVKITIGGQK